MNLKDYAHYYIGQPCLNTWFPSDHDAYDAGWNLTGFHASRVKPFGLENETDKTWTDSIVLKLRRLESMTEEERVEIFGTDTHWYKPFDATDACDSQQWHKLLTRGFDLFGLIEGGCAVER